MLQHGGCSTWLQKATRARAPIVQGVARFLLPLLDHERTDLRMGKRLVTLKALAR